MTMTLANYKTQVEQALVQVLRLALATRGTVADLAALAALDVSALAHGGLAYVTDQTRVYQLDMYSTAAHSSPNVIAPTTAHPVYAGARWVRVTSAATYGPNWRAPLHARSTGICRAVELYQGQEGEEAQFTRLLAQTPSLMLEANQDEPRPLSCGAPGSLYRSELPLTLTFFSDNYRGSPWAGHGSPTSLGETDDPGPAALIGEVRRILAGIDLGLDGVDRVEIGSSRLVDEQLAERYQVWEMDLTVLCFPRVPDEDLDSPTVIQGQPELTDTAAGKFDIQNFVSAGYHVAVPDPGSLTATPAAGTAIVGGVAVSSTPLAKAFTASRDTYMDLKADGTFTYVEAYLGHPAPSVTTGALRVGRVVTDETKIVSFTYLCSTSMVYRAYYQIAP